MCMYTGWNNVENDSRLFIIIQNALNKISNCQHAHRKSNKDD